MDFKFDLVQLYRKLTKFLFDLIRSLLLHYSALLCEWMWRVWMKHCVMDGGKIYEKALWLVDVLWLMVRMQSHGQSSFVRQHHIHRTSLVDKYAKLGTWNWLQKNLPDWEVQSQIPEATKQDHWLNVGMWGLRYQWILGSWSSTTIEQDVRATWAQWYQACTYIN